MIEKKRYSGLSVVLILGVINLANQDTAELSDHTCSLIPLCLQKLLLVSSLADVPIWHNDRTHTSNIIISDKRYFICIPDRSNDVIVLCRGSFCPISITSLIKAAYVSHTGCDVEDST